MVTITPAKKKTTAPAFPKECLKNTRALTGAEIETLKKNRNHSDRSDWSNVLVSKKSFDPDLVYGSAFSGFVVLGQLRNAKVKYHDLELECGIYNSKLRDVVTGNDHAIHNVAYL